MKNTLKSSKVALHRHYVRRICRSSHKTVKKSL